MEKLEKHIADAIFEDYSIPAHYPTVKRTAGYAKSLAIEFAEWCSQNGYELWGDNWVTYNVPKTQKEITKTSPELFDLFLSQKQF